MDLVYAVSVFTHLGEVDQDAWLAELRRVTKPGGILLLSVHSELGNEVLTRQDGARLEEQGFLFRPDYMIASDVFGAGYQNTYHTADYITRHWGELFEIVGRVPMGRQDFVILRPRGS